MKAVAAKKELAALPKATHSGTLKIGDIEIPCAVLEDGTRVFSESGITEALLGVRSGASKRLKKQAEEAGTHLPVFIAPGQLRPYITKEISEGPLRPIRYVMNGRAALGFEATLLPAACEIWLNARQAGALQKQQLDKAQKAEILMRGLARVGVIALVDEATGYQKDRAKDALAQILEKFVAKELQLGSGPFLSIITSNCSDFTVISSRPRASRSGVRNFLGKLRIMWFMSVSPPRCCLS